VCHYSVQDNILSQRLLYIITIIIYLFLIF